MELFDYIVLLFSCVAEIYICYSFVNAFLFKRSESLLMNSIAITAGTVGIFLINLIGNADLNLFLVPGILLAFIILVFKGKIIQYVLYTILTFVILLGGELLLVIFTGITHTDSAINLAEVPGTTFVSKLISYVLLILIKQFSGRSKEHMTKRVFILYLGVPIASLIMVMITFFVTENYMHNNLIKIALTLSYALMLLCNMIIFYAFNNYAAEVQKNLEQEWQIEKERKEKEYYIRAAETGEEQRTIIHDLKHYLRLIAGVGGENRNGYVDELVQKLNVDIEKSEKRIMSNAPILDVLLSERKIFAEKEGVSFEVFVEPGLRFGKTGEANYIIMLSNILENAIEAAIKSRDKKEVKVSIYRSSNDNFIVCRVENTYDKDTLKFVNNELISNKDSGVYHGYGIKSITSAAEAAGGIFKLEFEGEKATADLVIPI